MSQKQVVIERLHTEGRVSRNDMIKLGIVRLSAIMLNLKAEGWCFNTSETEDDFWYITEGTKPIAKKKSMPTKKGKIIPTF